MAEGAPLLREYVGKTCIEGSNPSDSAKHNIEWAFGPIFHFCHAIPSSGALAFRARDELSKSVLVLSNIGQG